jgi:hypothetical protein
MATFPALKPATRRYSMGVFPVTEERGFGGGSIRFRHGSTAYGHTLDLTFTALTQADAKLLRDHYRTQQGGSISFALSSEAWAGHTSFTDLVPTTTVWRYASQPEETHVATDRIDVTVSLLSVPDFISAYNDGISATVIHSIATALTPPASASTGLTRTVTVQFDGGTATGG